MSWLGRSYIFSIVVSFTVMGWWALWTLRENPASVSLTVWVPSWDLADPLVRQSFAPTVAQLMSGWLCALATFLLLAIRIPFRLRAAAQLIRRQRELEREVLELRTLPLRQHEEDEELAHEAQLETRAKRVMTEQLSLVAGQRPRADLLGLPEDTTTQGVRP